MDFDFAIVSLLSFLIVVLVGNFIAKKYVIKKRKRVQMIYTHYIKNFLIYGKNFTEQK